MSTPSNASDTTILAVDDDRAVLGMLDQILTEAGYCVLLADSGRGAIEMFENSQATVDLLLADVIMPDLTGPVVAQRLCARQPELRVVFISGFHDADLVQRFASLKGFTLLPKPFTVTGLLRVVHDALNSVKS